MLVIIIIVGIIVISFILYFLFRHHAQQHAPDPPSSIKLICTSTFPSQRETTNTLALAYIKQLVRGDLMFLSGIYIDMDVANPTASFSAEIGAALARGARVWFFTDPYSDVEPTYNNGTVIAPFVARGARWVHMGAGGALNSHVKFCDFIFFSQGRAAFYYGSYNPFSPVTAEAGLFIEGKIEETIVAQSITRDKMFLMSYIPFNPQLATEIRALGAELSKMGAAILGGENQLPAATVVWPEGSTAQCVARDSKGEKILDLTPSVAWKSAQTIEFPIARGVQYSIGFMPDAALATLGASSAISARLGLLAMLSRAQRYIKMALLFTHFSDDYLRADDPFQLALLNVLRDAFARGVFIALYIGIYNDQVNWLDRPQFGRLIDYITNNKPSDNFRLFIYPSYSLHFKFYVTEKDVLISNNMPHRSFYLDTIQGVDICFRDCPEINAFFDNLFNGFVSSYSDIGNAQYLRADSVYSIPRDLVATKTNMLLCGNGCVAGDFGCCIPHTTRSEADVCRLRFLPSYVDDPTNSSNFFSVMLDVINKANKFIIIVNEFTHLGCDPAHFATLDEWNQTTQRRQVNATFYAAFARALGRGVLVFIASSQSKEGAQLKDTLSPSLRAIAAAQVFTTDLDNLGYIYRDQTSGAQKVALSGAGSFVHDKLYVTDQSAYVGGQNWYSPLELDAGFLIERGPVYFDLLSRAQSIIGLGYKPFEYTVSNPYKGNIIDTTSGAKYSGAVYPCISPLIPRGEPTPFSTISYSPREPVESLLNAYIRQLDNAVGAIDVFCWTMSPVEFFVADKNKTPYFIDTQFIDAIQRATNRASVTEITIVLCIHSTKFELFEYKNATSDPYCTGAGMEAAIWARYKQAYNELYAVLAAPKVSMYLQGMLADRVPTSISSCNLFHAKVIATENSISASSANFTAGYFFSASNTGVVVEIPRANQIVGYEEFKEKIFALRGQNCVSGCGAEVGQPCLRAFKPTVNLATYCGR